MSYLQQRREEYRHRVFVIVILIIFIVFIELSGRVKVIVGAVVDFLTVKTDIVIVTTGLPIAFSWASTVAV